MKEAEAPFRKEALQTMHFRVGNDNVKEAEAERAKTLSINSKKGLSNNREGLSNSPMKLSFKAMPPYARARPPLAVGTSR